MEDSDRGGPECGESAEGPDEARRAENGENLSKGKPQNRPDRHIATYQTRQTDGGQT